MTRMGQVGAGEREMQGSKTYFVYTKYLLMDWMGAVRESRVRVSRVV